MARRRRPLIIGGVLLLLGGAACSANRIEGGVFYSAKGFRVALPAAGGGWEVAPDGPADIQVRRSAPRAGMLANATCEGKAPTRPLAILVRHLAFGIRGKEILEQSDLTLAGHPAVRVRLTGRLDGSPVEVEAYVVKGERCVYDLIYVASPSEFAAGTVDFRTFLSSFEGP